MTGNIKETKTSEIKVEKSRPVLPSSYNETQYKKYPTYLFHPQYPCTGRQDSNCISGPPHTGVIIMSM